MSIKEQTDKKVEAIRALRLWMQEQVKIGMGGSLSALNNGFCEPLTSGGQHENNSIDRKA